MTADLVASRRHISAVTAAGDVAAVVSNEWWAAAVHRRSEPSCELLQPHGR